MMLQRRTCMCVLTSLKNIVNDKHYHESHYQLIADIEVVFTFIDISNNYISFFCRYICDINMGSCFHNRAKAVR